MFKIIQIRPDDGAVDPGLDADNKRTVRSHAMRHVRQQQKNARNGDKGSGRPLRPAPSSNRRANGHQKLNGDKEPGDNDNHEKEASKASALVPTSTSWSTSFNWQGETSTVPHMPISADFYRYCLAESFGASLIGSGLRRPRSSGILCYRGYVATTNSDLVHATDDTMCLLLPGCSLMDTRILLEGRKRYLAGVQWMQKALEAHARDKDGAKEVLSTIAGALEILFIEIFKPVSLGSGSLYGGLVHLVRSHWTQLTSFRTNVPVTRFILAQLRQVMLMEALTSRTALPIGVEAWQSVPHASGLVPEMTEALMPLATQVPGLLETARQLSASEWQNPSNAQKLLTGIVTLESRLMQWQQDWSLDSYDNVAFSFPSKTAEEFAGPGRCPILRAQKLHSIPFLSAQCLTLCYICLLLLRETAANLSAACDEEDAPNDKYLAHATWTADRLCELAEYFIQDGDGLLSRALSVCAPLHFARLWYEANDDLEGAAATSEQRARAQKEMPFLSWESLLPLSLLSMYMHA